MRLTVIGCSGSFPGPTSPASCYLLEADHEGRTWRILLDLGSGALGVLQRHIDPAQVDGVFLSHLHPDHCVDLTGLYVTRKYRPQGPLTDPLAVHGPAGTFEQIVAMYHGSKPADIAAQYAVHEVNDGWQRRLGPFEITAIAVNHPVEAYGYRVRADDRVLAFTGDTDSCPGLLPLMAGADLVLADAAFVDGRDDATQGIHLSGSRAAQAAVDAGGVRRLMLTHIPAWNDPEVCRAQAAAIWPGEVELARSELVTDV